MLVSVNRVIPISQELRRYEELEIEVKQLCGYNFECLKELFAMGYTLQPPEHEMTMNQAMRIYSMYKGE